MGFIDDYKKAKKKIEKNQKKVEKLFGTDPKKTEPKQITPKKKAPVWKKYKLSNFNIEIARDFSDIEQGDTYYLADTNDNVIGKFPSSAENFLDNYDGQNMEFYITVDGLCIVKYEDVE